MLADHHLSGSLEILQNLGAEIEFLAAAELGQIAADAIVSGSDVHLAAIPAFRRC